MANLKDTIILGNLTVTGSVVASSILNTTDNSVTLTTDQTITGTKTFDAPIKTTANCLGSAATPLAFVVGISAFNQGGQMYWQEADKFVFNNIPKFYHGSSGVTHSDWQSNANASSKIPTMNFIAYWNGAYAANNSSNLTYCKRGEIAALSDIPSGGGGSTVTYNSTTKTLTVTN